MKARIAELYEKWRQMSRERGKYATMVGVLREKLAAAEARVRQLEAALERIADEKNMIRSVELVTLAREVLAKGMHNES